MPGTVLGVAAATAAAAAKSLQSCPILCDPIDGGPPGSPVPGILQARTLEWVVISFSKAWKGKVKVKLLSRVRLFATPWSAAYQAPPSLRFSRQEYWSGVPLPSPVTAVLIHLIFIPSFWGMYYHYSHFINEKTRAKRWSYLHEATHLLNDKAWIWIQSIRLQSPSPSILH